MQGKIIRGIGGFYYINACNSIYECKAKGSFRKEGIKPLVGDDCIIDMLDEKYDRMMNEINTIVLSRLTNSTIIYDVKSPEGKPSEQDGKSSSEPVIPRPAIGPDDPCPCGSLKKYRECHGNSRHTIVRRRR